ncbi:MAG: integrase [Ahrensia sp.]|nr:integrase [Ahrensia sp.]|tara:strand:+ start:13290 stop:14861 length:1572 start_codon:yes stop_codon:yes gene_type:complete
MAAKIRNLLCRDGRYFARKVIPKKLRPFFDGKTELREALGPDRRTAISRLHAILATWELDLAEARRRLHGDVIENAAGNRPNAPLSERQMAVAHYFTELDLDLAERRYPDRGIISDMSWTRKARRKVLIDTAAGISTNEEMDAAIGWAIDAFRDRRNHNLVRGSEEWRALAMSLAASQLEALDRARERDRGDFAGRPTNSLLADAIPEADKPKPVSIVGLLDAYLSEREASGKGQVARKRWTPVIKKFVKQIGHDDATRLTKAEIIGWKEASLDAGLSPRTIKAVNLAALKAALNWAIENDKIAENPAANVDIRVDRKPSSRERGFRDDEALAILKFSKLHKRSGRESEALANAKRWVPLLCAHTGARVGEILQLRRQDVFERDGLHAIRITPEAGTVKAGGHRDVPLHEQVIAEGFLDFVQGHSGGPLFLNTTNGAPPRTAVDTAQGRLRQWLGAKHLIPHGLQPNHAWRHRFKTIGREAGIDSRILDALQGHAPRTAGDNYGDVTLRAMKNAIDLIQRYKL